MGLASLGGGLLDIHVSRLEEFAEQIEEGHVDTQTKAGTKNIDLFATGRGNNHTHTKYHLDNLESGDCIFEGGLIAHGSSSVVGIHNRMNKEVHNAEKVSSTVVVVHVEPSIGAEKEGDDVVIVVEEVQGPLAQDNEEGIHELQNFGNVEQKYPSGTIAKGIAILGIANE